MQYYKQCGRQGCYVFAFFCDVRKAFDMIQWKFLIIILQKTVLQLDFVSRIKQICMRQEAEITLEEYTSPKISLHRGVRQGCPLLPLLFNIVIEA